MARCPQCLCVPAECNSCLVCDSRACCALAHAKRRPVMLRVFGHARGMFAAALGIEILCIAFAEIGENAGFMLFGYRLPGAAIAYAMGYSLAGLSTFLTILGRSKGGECGEGCCSLLENAGRKGIWANLYGTLWDLASGARRLARREQNLKSVVRSSLVIFVTAETACILAAETVDLVFYQYSVLLSIPLSLLAGVLAIVLPQAYRKARAG